MYTPDYLCNEREKLMNNGNLQVYLGGMVIAEYRNLEMYT
jgi:hypothetical protein